MCDARSSVYCTPVNRLTVMTDPSLAQAYDYCMRMTRSHYENFPVASRLLPRALRPAVSVIYAFARRADDFADEGALSPVERLAHLDDYLYKLDTLSTGASVNDPIFIALADVKRRTDLPLQPLYDLLSAFRQDVVKHRYANIDEMQLRTRTNSPVLRALIDKQIDRSRALLLAGAPLGRRLCGRFGVEIRATENGGLAVLDALARKRDDVFARPRLRRRDWTRVLWRSLLR